jgi:DMSO reductase anchor subunit
VPAVLLVFFPQSLAMLATAFATQYAGLLAERWYFFAEAKHPQNLYYQAIA